MRRNSAQERRANELRKVVSAHGGVISTSEARQAGITEARLKWALEKEILCSLRRGVYASGRLWAKASPGVRHQLQLLAHQRLHPSSVACAASAAVALGLPTPVPPTRLRLTTARDPRRHGVRGRRAGALCRQSWLDDGEIQVQPGGLRVTTPLRTVLDCAREWERPWGMAIADAAMARYRIVAAELISAARQRPSAPGTGRAVWVAEQARTKIESPLESLARGVIVLAGLPEPQPQVWIPTRRGRFRVDLVDLENRVITEADGRVKYDSGQALWEEKLREDALRDEAFEVIRFTAADYAAQAPWLDAYRRAMARGRARPR